ncbi:S66 peptidase family protein [Streptomyces sp. LZ34]
MNTPLRIPAPVGPGAHIRIVSPTSPSAALLPDRARRGESALTGLGFTLSYGRHALDTSHGDGTTAGDARQRAADLMEAFEDPSVDAVLSADAGDGSVDLLDFLDPEVFAAHPKPFIGFCDNVVLNQFLASHAGLSSLYGCTLIAQLGESGGAFPETVDSLARALNSSAPLTCRPVGDRTGEWINWYVTEMDSRPRHRRIRGGWTWIGPGRATGPLVGGEMMVLPPMIERFELSLRSAVLFWHVTFKSLEPETTFRWLCETADLNDIAGMVVGAHPTIPPPEWAGRVADLLDELLPGLRCPVVVNADISHLGPAWTVPYGEPVTLDSSKDTIEFPRAGAMAHRGGP